MHRYYILVYTLAWQQKKKKKNIINVTVHRFYLGGTRNRLQLREMVCFKCFSFSQSLWPLRSIYESVLDGPPVTVTDRLNRSVTPKKATVTAIGIEKPLKANRFSELEAVPWTPQEKFGEPYH